MADDEGTVTALEDLLEQHDVAVPLELEHLDDVERLVEHDLLAAAQGLVLDGGAEGHPQLAAAGEDVGGAVLVRLEHGAEAGRRLGQPVDLFLERQDLVAGLTQRRGEPVVLAGDLRQAGLGLGEPLLDRAQLARRVGQLAPQQAYLLLEERDLSRQVVHVLLEVGTLVGVPCHCAHHPPGNGPVISHPTVGTGRMFRGFAGPPRSAGVPGSLYRR